MFPLNIVWYHQPAADRLISASLLTFPGTWKQNWESVWQRLREETAEVITWFHLSWFWFKKGRACHKRKKKEKNNNPTEKRSERTETHSERRDALNKKRWRQLITPHSNEIKWHREAMEESSARRNTNKKITSSLFFHCYFVVLISPEDMTVYLTPDRLEEDGQTQRGLWPRTPLMLC